MVNSKVVPTNVSGDDGQFMKISTNLIWLSAFLTDYTGVWEGSFCVNYIFVKVLVIRYNYRFLKYKENDRRNAMRDWRISR